jgi:PAS domain S-box-containing protein
MDGESAAGVRLLYVTPSDERAREAASELAATERVTVETCETVEAAMATLGTSDRPECLVSDHDLPDIDAVAFLQMVRSQYPDLPFVLFTSEGDESVASRAISAGVTDYLIRDEHENQWAALVDLVETAVEYYRTQTDLVETEARARTILEASPDAVGIIRDRRFVYANASAVDVFGVDDAAALTGEPLHQFLHASGQSLTEERLRRIQAGESSIDRLNSTVVGTGSRTVPVELYATRIEWEGAPATILVVRRIAESEGSDRLLRRFHRAVHAAGHAVFITDVDGTITYVNPAFEQITGYTAAEAIDETPRLLKSGYHGAAFYQDLWETILDGEIWEAEVVNEAKSGERYNAHQTVAPVSDEDGDLVEFVAIQTDVTDRKEREQQLHVLERILRHNVHNDMSVVLGQAERIEIEADGEIAAAARQIRETGGRLLETVDKERDIVELLSESRPIQTIDLCERVQRTVDSLAETYSHAAIDTTIPGPVRVTAITEIEVGLSELVENAIIHSDRSTPTVEVRVEVGDETVTVQVIDDGPRIAEEESEVLTSGESLGPLYHGSGLGLWLVNWIVKRSDGVLRFSENEPRGNVVTMELNRTGRPE